MFFGILGDSIPGLSGKKLLSEDFLAEIQGNDIIGLAETHIHSGDLEDLVIPGYVLLVYRDCNPKSHTAPCGLAVFCKEHLSSNLIPIMSNNNEVLWLKIKKESTGLEKDIYLGTIYISPSGNKAGIQKICQTLADDISTFKEKGYIILQGDFNAHTNKVPDFIKQDDFVEGRSFDCNTPIPLRNAEDNNNVDLRGEELNYAKP